MRGLFLAAAAIAPLIFAGPALAGEATDQAAAAAIGAMLSAATRTDVQIAALRAQAADTDSRLKWVLDHWVKPPPAAQPAK